MYIPEILEGSGEIYVWLIDDPMLQITTKSNPSVTFLLDVIAESGNITIDGWIQF
jgi:hypothetical protein